MVTEIDEEQAAMVANPVNPSAQPYFLVNVGGPEGAAGVAPVTMHVASRDCSARQPDTCRKAAGKAHGRAILSRLPATVAPSFELRPFCTDLPGDNRAA
ncbi:MAG: hypothetical protein ACTSP2_04945, partial [Alphaproteobacteria bacterium]